MKRCPECRKDYRDDSLLYCLDDGTALVQGSLTDEHATAILSGQVRRMSVSDDSSSGVAYREQGSADVANSIAVLPFANLSADVENEFFCDGLAEELLNALAKIDELKVAARTSAFAFKGKNTNVSEIARELGVEKILEGSVRKSGERLRITVQLINAANGYHVWSERYDREMKDIFDVQDEITLSVVDALKLKLFGEEKEAVLRRYTNNAAAYELYLRGRFFFYKRSLEGFQKAIECFQRAIDIDSRYALAVSGLADCYSFLGFYEVSVPSAIKGQAEEAIQRALAIDDTLAETHASAAFYCVVFEWNFDRAEEHFQKARSLNPKYSLTYHLHACNLILKGRWEECIASAQEAVRLDPFTVMFNAGLGYWLYLIRGYDKSVAQAMTTLDIARHFFAYWVLGLAYAAQTMHTEAVTAFQQAISAGGFEQQVRGDLGRALALSGLTEEAHEVLDSLVERQKSEYISPVNIAKVYAGLRETELFFEWLGKAYEEHSIRLPWFMVDPCLDEYRGDPRFKEIIGRMGLAERDI